mmetsp:Transcript_27321/g.42435  ORF Transcript_27321/g.42435 Transcript_27321/m.42435 type:complete len:80 (-) Transcript_27321:70-309(-)
MKFSLNKFLVCVLLRESATVLYSSSCSMEFPIAKWWGFFLCNFLNSKRTDGFVCEGSVCKFKKLLPENTNYSSFPVALI